MQLPILFALVCVLASCTFVNIEGDHNTVSDTGGHGGGISLPAQQTTLKDRLEKLQSNH